MQRPTYIRKSSCGSDHFDKTFNWITIMFVLLVEREIYNDLQKRRTLEDLKRKRTLYHLNVIEIGIRTLYVKVYQYSQTHMYDILTSSVEANEQC